MGYSYTAKAGFTSDAVQEIMDRDYPSPDNSTNRMPDGGFWEHGRENEDGAITGTVFALSRRLSYQEKVTRAAEVGQGCKPEWIGDQCFRRGSFRIEPDGRISRFPGLTAEHKREAEKRGAAMYAEIYESPRNLRPAFGLV